MIESMVYAFLFPWCTISLAQCHAIPQISMLHNVDEMLFFGCLQLNSTYEKNFNSLGTDCITQTYYQQQSTIEQKLCNNIIILKDSIDDFGELLKGGLLAVPQLSHSCTVMVISYEQYNQLATCPHMVGSPPFNNSPKPSIQVGIRGIHGCFEMDIRLLIRKRTHTTVQFLPGSLRSSLKCG